MVREFCRTRASAIKVLRLFRDKVIGQERAIALLKNIYAFSILVNPDEVDPIGTGRLITKLRHSHGGRCFYCNEYVTTDFGPNQATKDHILPRSLGGPNSLSNYVLSCRACNEEKANGIFPLSLVFLD